MKIAGSPAISRQGLKGKETLDDIYKIWQNLRLPMPILGRATLDNWEPIPKDSIWLPENARRHNDELNRQNRTIKQCQNAVTTSKDRRLARSPVAPPNASLRPRPSFRRLGTRPI